VCFTWLFFRSTSFDLTLAYLRGLSALDFGGAKALGPVALLSALTLAIDLPQALSNDELRVARAPRLVRIPIAAAVLVLLVLSGDSGQPFIYFQF
jgi:hypothetical protein